MPVTPSFVEPTPWQTLPPVELHAELHAERTADRNDPAGPVDLWLFFHEATDHPARFDSYFSLITDEERSRHDRFVFDRDRRIFLATRALVRCVLSEYTGIDPRDFRFVAGAHGKPALVAPAPCPALSFNLSNTHDLVVCAVTAGDAMLGVDAESIDRVSDLLGIVDRFFAPAEVAALRRLPTTQQRQRFFSYWTLKESYIKARGLGLAIPLEQFAFQLDHVERPQVVFSPALGDDASQWHFALLSAHPKHMVALAKQSRTPLAVRARRYVPLVGSVPPIR